MFPNQPPRYPDKTPIAQEELQRLPDDGYRYEWWNGELRVSPGPSIPHQDCLLAICSFLRAYFRSAQNGCVVLGVDVNIPQQAIVCPDFLLLLGENAKKAPRSGAIPFVPDLAGEVISPTHKKRDRVEKRRVYQKLGVRYYILIDNEARTL